ncbi:MAG: deoxynucleoside kinase [Bacteriovoracales bacterium]|nr:deoxynucleoside kinase [Bacteriovoracales bacterium]
MLPKAYPDLSSGGSRGMFIIVAGNIGSGKTTLTKKLSERLGWRPHFESVQNNPYLKDFYEDMERWSFPLQIYFLTHRFNIHRSIENSNFTDIQDRSIYEDAHIFARALFEQKYLSPRDYENYIGLYESMIQFLYTPDLMIGLRRSIPKLLDRIKSRGRNYEKSISVDYLTRLNSYYDDWFEKYSFGKSLIIDTDEFDFLENEDDFDFLVQKIYDSIDQKDLFFPKAENSTHLS